MNDEIRTVQTELSIGAKCEELFVGVSRSFCTPFWNGIKPHSHLPPLRGTMPPKILQIWKSVIKAVLPEGYKFCSNSCRHLRDDFRAKADK